MKQNRIDPKLNYVSALRMTIDSLQEDIRGFEKVRDYLKNLTGVNLITNQKNLSLMANRLGKILAENECQDYSDYIACLLKPGDNSELKNEFISSMTTHTTEFFREPFHFEELRKITEEKLKSHSVSELRVWCAAASTGQEPYTIAMVLLDVTSRLRPLSVKILATDIDIQVLQIAAKGNYKKSDLDKLPANFRERFFVKANGNSGPTDMMAASKELKSALRFAPLNLALQTYPFQHRFDVIFCRNVLIYFEKYDAEKIVDRLVNSLNVGGHLFVGHSESSAVTSSKVKKVGMAIYQKVK